MSRARRIYTPRLERGLSFVDLFARSGKPAREIIMQSAAGVFELLALYFLHQKHVVVEMHEALRQRGNRVHVGLDGEGVVAGQEFPLA